MNGCRYNEIVVVLWCALTVWWGMACTGEVDSGEPIDFEVGENHGEELNGGGDGDDENAPSGANDSDVNGEGIDDVDWRVRPDPVLFAHPFGDGSVGETRVNIENFRDETLVVEVEISDDGGDGAFYPGKDWPAGPQTIETDGRLSFFVAHHQKFEDVIDEGVMTITTNDPNRQVHDVRLSNDEPDGELVLSTEEVEFPSTNVEETHVIVVEMENKGSEMLRIREFSLTEGDQAFDVEYINPATSTGNSSRVYPDDPPVEIIIEFEPPEAGLFDGTVRIETTDPEEPVREIALSGQGALL